MFATFVDGELRAHLDEYSEVNIEFHQSIIRMSGNSVLIDLAEVAYDEVERRLVDSLAEQLGYRNIRSVERVQSDG